MATVFFSCRKKDAVTEEPERERLEIEARIDSALSKRSFQSGDRIGVFLVDYTDGTPGTLGDFRYPINRLYTYGEGVWYPDDGQELYAGGEQADVYAYYPYDPELGNTDGKMNVTAYPFMVNTDQQDGDPGADFLWAKEEGVSVVSGSVRILFRHLFSRIVVNLIYELEGTPPESLRFYNLTDRCSIDLRNGSTTPLEGSAIYTPFRWEEPAPEYQQTFEAIVIPQRVPADTPLFATETGSDILLYVVPEETVFESGKSYTFNLTVGEAVPAFGKRTARLTVINPSMP